MRATSIRLYMEEPLAADRDIPCSRAQANYLRNVMRLGDGDEIFVFDGRTGEWRARVRPQGRGACMLHVLEQTRAQEEGPDIDYLFAPLKRARLDYMVQKATELGVATLQPVITRRTDVSRIKLERMQANAIEAAEQCGVLHIPEVREPVSLDNLIEGWAAGRRLIFCDEEEPIASPLAALKALEPGPIAVLIGPEGGFEEGERGKLRGLSFVTPISLGPRVMRADTAAVAALALVNAVLGDWR